MVPEIPRSHRSYFLGNTTKATESVKNLGVIQDADNSVQRTCMLLLSRENYKELVGT